MGMTNEEKGYSCPDLEHCDECQYFKTKCIVFSTEGKKKLAEWEKKQKKKKRNIEELYK